MNSLHVDTPIEWSRNLKPADGYVYDKERAIDAVTWWMEHLTNTRGKWSGSQFMLAPWQTFLIARFFGTIHKETGLRQYRNIFLGIPKKSGKTEFAAGLALMMLYYDAEHSPEVYTIAANVAQASIVYACARSMVENNEDLYDLIGIRRSLKELQYENGRLKVMSAEKVGKQGYSPSCVVGDELHEHKSDDAWSALTSPEASIAREQPLNIGLTTAGKTKYGIGWEVWQYALDVQRGEVEDSTLIPSIWSAQDASDWENPEVWKACNPSIGYTMNFDSVEAGYKDALKGPREEAQFRQWRLCQWVDRLADTWIPMMYWDACAAEPQDPSQRTPIYAGLDLGLSRDLTSLSIIWKDDQGKIHLKCISWIAREGLRERIRRDKVPYDVWVQKGYLRVTNGSMTDLDQLEAELIAMFKGRPVVLGIDRWSAEQLMQHLEKQNLTVHDVRQRPAALHEASTEFEKVIMEQQINHGGCPMLRWALSHTVLKMDSSGYIMPCKRVSTERIDPISATINAFDMMIRYEAVPRTEYQYSRTPGLQTAGLREHRW